MAMFTNIYQDDRSPYGSKRNTLDMRKMTMPELDHHTFSPTELLDQDINPEEARFARLNRINNYVLPPAVRDAQQAWTIWSQGIAVTTALFAAVEAQLFSLIAEADRLTPLNQAFRVFSYLGLLSNLLATTSALFVLERISGLSTRARRLSLEPNSLPGRVADGVPLPQDLLHPLRETALLRAFGMDATWGYTIAMFYFFSIAGCISIFVQLSLYLFIRESVAIACVLTGLVMFGLTPLVVLTLRIGYEFLFD